MTPIWVLASEATSLETKQETEKAPSQKGTEPLAKDQPLTARVGLALLGVQLSGCTSISRGLPVCWFAIPLLAARKRQPAWPVLLPK
jgi:hypothetical protein